MPRRASAHRDAGLSVVFAPLDGAGRAELVEQRLTDAIISGVLRDGERLPSESDLARSLGVAVVTAREALESLRGRGLVRTRRGREGGSFVTYDREAAVRMLDDRMREHSRIELRDLALHAAAITGMAAGAAADRASDDDLERLRTLHESADLSTPGSARRAAGLFQLELAAVSQSPRLVREEVRLQSEAWPMLWMCLREPAVRMRQAHARVRILDAIRAVDPAAARASAVAPIEEALAWLLDAKLRLESSAVTGAAPLKEPLS